jgi:hypothetical protein
MGGGVNAELCGVGGGGGSVQISGVDVMGERKKGAKTGKAGARSWRASTELWGVGECRVSWGSAIGEYWKGVLGSGVWGSGRCRVL